MLWTLLAMLLVVWALGLAFGVGNIIHTVLAVALVVLVIQLIQTRKTAHGPQS